MKALKIILIVAAMIAAVYVLVFLIGNDKDVVEPPEIDSPTAKEWKNRIDKLCRGYVWSSSEYEKIDQGISADHDMHNMTIGEKSSLKDYLFAMSCMWLDTTSDKLFKQSSYPKGRVSQCQEALTFLSLKKKNDQPNSHFNNASSLLGAYSRIMSLINPERQARYSIPLEAFPSKSAANAKREILGMKYYKSHFCNNPTISNAVNDLEQKYKAAERQYYFDLERCIEQHYNKTKDYNRLMDDDAELTRVSTNADACRKLEEFMSSLRNR